MAAPLAFAALPLYVLFPQFYATELGLSLGALGALLLLVRALDAITDPLIGRWLDAHLHTHNLLRMALVACVVLGLGFGPPSTHSNSGLTPSCCCGPRSCSQHVRRLTACSRWHCKHG